MATQRSVLITGCSDGGLGAALALAFHRTGLKVYATARDTAKLRVCEAAGISTLTLDVLSTASIQKAVREVSAANGGSLDILVNNAGGFYAGPLSDADLNAARALFDLNVWNYVAMTQAFLPLLIKSSYGAMIVNQSSLGSLMPIPFNGIEGASKAATAMLTNTMRLELRDTFGIRVVDLRTGGVATNILKNNETSQIARLRDESIWNPVRMLMEKVMWEAFRERSRMSPDVWAKGVVQNLLIASPPRRIWKGTGVWAIWFIAKLPVSLTDRLFTWATGLSQVGKALKATSEAMQHKLS